MKFKSVQNGRKEDWRIRMLNFIGRWDFVDMRFLQIEYPSKNIETIRSGLKQFVKLRYLRSIHFSIRRNNIDPDSRSGKHGGTVAIWQLTNKGIKFIHKEDKWIAQAHTYNALDHNLTCYKLIRSLHPGVVQYWTSRDISAEFKEKKKFVRHLTREKQNVDLIYDCGDGKRAVEVELTMKSHKRYWGESKYTVFKKLNEDFEKGVFRKLEFWIPRKLDSPFRTMLKLIPKGSELNVPYEILFIEDKLKSWDSKDRYTIIPKVKTGQYKQLTIFDV